MFQIAIFFQLLNYFKLIMSLVLPFFPGDADSDN